MKTAGMLILTLMAVGTARADFSYVSARKGGQGPAASMGPQSTKQYFKGQKMKTESGDVSTIIDFDAKTVTMIYNTQRSYTVAPFADLGKVVPTPGGEAKIDLKETGQTKTINGFNAKQAVLSMEVDGMGGPSGMKMLMEMELWVSPDVPGASELKAFYARNAANFPMMAGGGNSAMQKSMTEIQKRMAGLGGVAVLQITRMKPLGGGVNPAQAAQAQAGMAQAMAQLEAMRKQGGAQAQAAEAALARMGGTGGGAGAGALFEMTMESTDFSTAAIPDSVFAIPAGYQKR